MPAHAWHLSPLEAVGALRCAALRAALLHPAQHTLRRLRALPLQLWPQAAAFGALGLGVAIAVMPLLHPLVGAAATVMSLERAAAGVLAGDVLAEPADPLGVILLLAEEPASRAASAAYQAALQRPGASGFRPISGGDPHSQVLAALDQVDAIYAAPVPTASSAPPLVLPRLRARIPRRQLVSAPAHLQAVIHEAAILADVDPSFLATTAARESAFNPYAAASTSSARGLFQFIRQTWLISVSKWGAKHGLAREARMIRVDRTGRAHVDEPGIERAILSLRYDPVIASRLAAETVAENARELTGALQRGPTRGELYAAHVLGSAGAVRLARAVASRPHYPAAWLLPKAAAANRGLFYRGGRARSVSELLEAFG